MAELAGVVAQQATMLAFQDAFLLSALAAVAMLPLALVLRKPETSAGATAALAH